MNLCDSEQAKLFTDREFKKILEDMAIECSKHVKIKHAFIIRTHNSRIGAEVGSIFIELDDKKDAEKVTFKLNSVDRSDEWKFIREKRI